MNDTLTAMFDTTHFNSTDRNVVLLSFAYLLMVFMGKMRIGPFAKRVQEGGTLERIMVIWNFSLSTFSCIHTISAGICLWGRYHRHKWEDFVGLNGTWDPSFPICAHWGMIYVISRFAEFGDTVFLACRHKHMPLLHWFHHWATFLVCYKWVRETNGGDGLCVLLACANTFVHWVMYAYYGLKAQKREIPEIFAFLITTIQIIQMTYLMGGISYGYFVVRTVGPLLYITYFSMVTLYWLLFTQMWFNRYIFKSKKSNKAAKKRQ